MSASALANGVRSRSGDDTPRQRRVCVFIELFERGKMTQPQVNAAHEIARVFQAITSGLGVRVQDYQPRIRSKRHANEDWQASLSNAYTERYDPWRRWAGNIQIKYGVSIADIVITMVVHNVGIYQMADVYRMDRRTVLTVIRNGLHEYAKLSGWVDEFGKPISVD